MEEAVTRQKRGSESEIWSWTLLHKPSKASAATPGEVPGVKRIRKAEEEGAGRNLKGSARPMNVLIPQIDYLPFTTRNGNRNVKTLP